MTTATLESKKGTEIQKYYGRILDEAYGKPINAENMRVVPHINTLVVKEDDPERETEGGIIIPDTAMQKRLTGVIISVRDDDSAGYKVGQRVLFRDTGDRVTIEGLGEVVILQHCGGIDDNILCRFEPAEDVEATKTKWLCPECGSGSQPRVKPTTPSGFLRCDQCKTQLEADRFYPGHG